MVHDSGYCLSMSIDGACKHWMPCVHVSTDDNYLNASQTPLCPLDSLPPAMHCAVSSLDEGSDLRSPEQSMGLSETYALETYTCGPSAMQAQRMRWTARKLQRTRI